MEEKRAKPSRTPQKRRRQTVPRKKAEAVKAEVRPEPTPPVEPVVEVTEAKLEPTVVKPVIEEPKELPAILRYPVEVTLIEGASYQIKKANFVKGRPLLITDRELVERCSNSSRFKVVGGARNE